jgi:hypothetical protein
MRQTVFGAMFFGALVFGGGLGIGLSVGDAAFAQVQPPAVATPAAPVTATKPPPPKAPVVKAAVTKPLWTELNSTQKQALNPLAGTWNTLSEAQKRKWIALSQNYTSLPPAEQARLHERAEEWVALSPQQRSVARINFGQTKKVPPAEKQAKWEAYQALTPEEKKKLAQDAPNKVTGAAIAVKPVPRQKLTALPQPAKNAGPAPKIAAAPNQVDPHTLLPQQPGNAP